MEKAEMIKDHDTLSASINPYRSFRQVFLMVLAISLGALFFGYSIGVMSLAQNTIWEVFRIQPSDQSAYASVLSSSVFIGAMVGSISSGKLLDVVSRKQAFILTDILGVIAALSSQVEDINMFILSRLLTGVVTGLNSSLVPNYIQEVSPQSLSGTMGTVFAIVTNLGIFIASFNGQFFDEKPTPNDSYWRYVFLFPLLITVSRMILLKLFFNHETPYYYLLKKDTEGCDNFLNKMYYPEFIEDIKKGVQKMVDKEASSSQSYADMLSPDFKFRVIVGCSLQIFQQFSGINAVIMYSGQIFHKNGYSFGLTNFLSLFSISILLFSTLVSSKIVNTLGRRTILLYGSLLCAIFQLGLTLLSYLNIQSLQFIAVSFIFLYFLAFSFSLGPIVWLYCSEILPPKGISLSTTSNWLSGSLIVFMLPYFDSLWVLFLFYSGVCFACVVFTFFYVYETQGKSKLEIHDMFTQRQISLQDNMNSNKEHLNPLIELNKI